MSPVLSSSSLLVLARTLSIGLIGGAVFMALGLPVPWLSGPAFAVAIAALSRLELAVPNWLRTATLIFLGSTIGSAVTPETLDTLQQWPWSLAGLSVAVMAIMAGGAAYLERVHGYDRQTARLATIPGAMPYVMALAEQSHADVRRVAIIQMLRLACLLMLLPSALALLGYDSGHEREVRDANVVLWQIPLLMLGGWAGAVLLEKLRAPAPALFGSMVAAALLYGTGMLTSELPEWLMRPGLLIIGAMVGANFAGTDLMMLRATVLAGLGSLVVGSAIALAVAAGISAILDLPTAQLWLAYAPGGTETMAIMALALGLDAAFVGGHHVARFLGLGLIVPIWLRKGLITAKADTAQPQRPDASDIEPPEVRR